MKGIRILLSFTLSVAWLAGLLGPAGHNVRASEPAQVPAGLTAADWQALQVQLAKLTAGGGEPEDWFGWSVAVGVGIVVVGAPGVDVGGHANEGAAYVFYRDEGGPGNWGPVVMLTAADGGAGDNFGYAVAVDGDADIVVGSPLADPGGNADRGAAYIFSRDEGGEGTWGQQAKLTAGDGQPGDQFGYSVSIHSGWALVGAPFADYLSYEFGAAYIFNVNGGSIGAWGQIRKFLPVDCTLNGYFGSSVATDGTTAIIGADNTYVTGNPGQGAVWFYGRDQGGIWEWGRLTRVTAADGGAGDNFGFSVAANGSTVIAGACLADIGPMIDQGAAYVYAARGFLIYLPVVLRNLG